MSAQTTLRLLITCAVGLVIRTQVTATPAHHYPFNDKYQRGTEDVTPDMLSGADGVLKNGADIQYDASIAGNTLQLDGDDDYVALPEIVFGDIFRIEASVKIPLNQSNIQTILSTSGSTADTNGFKLFVNSHNTSDGRIIFESGDGLPFSGFQIFTNPGVFIFSNTEYRKIAIEVNRSFAPQVRIFYGANIVAEGLIADFSTSSISHVGSMTDDVWHLGGAINDLRIIPEPTMISLLALGGLVVAMRRKRC